MIFFYNKTNCSLAVAQYRSDQKLWGRPISDVKIWRLKLSRSGRFRRWSRRQKAIIHWRSVCAEATVPAAAVALHAGRPSTRHRPDSLYLAGRPRPRLAAAERRDFTPVQPAHTAPTRRRIYRMPSGAMLQSATAAYTNWLLYGLLLTSGGCWLPTPLAKVRPNLVLQASLCLSSSNTASITVMSVHSTHRIQASENRTSFRPRVAFSTATESTCSTVI